MPFFSPKGGEGAKGSAKGRTSDALRHCQHFPIPTPPWVEEKFCPPTRQAKGQKWICTLFPSRRQLFVLHSPTVAHTDVPPAVMALGHTILLSVAVAKCHSDTGQPEVATPFILNPLTPLFVVPRIATSRRSMTKHHHHHHHWPEVAIMQCTNVFHFIYE
ncbi:hypothetical protein ZHAS_00014134 [Anopheles sinensis]|uniref:Uncharacterized protein n=1 Tax=Anopheles sinensis TaxID=74873 RepID=A0A084W7Q2_ANOSI|nr:hypothetical protein ZHAS_00014134 [Anopheles sinensis]